MMLIIVVMKLPNTHDDTTTLRSYDWSVGSGTFSCTHRSVSESYIRYMDAFRYKTRWF